MLSSKCASLINIGIIPENQNQRVTFDDSEYDGHGKQYDGKQQDKQTHCNGLNNRHLWQCSLIMGSIGLK